MLIAYKPDYQKITMGLLSLIPDLKETQHLTEEMEWYSKDEDRLLYIWKSEETGDMVGVIGVEEEQQDLLLLRHIALNPSYRQEGITYDMLTALSERHPDKRIMGTLETSSLVSKWEQFRSASHTQNQRTKKAQNMSPLTIKTELFDGPLDLLLHLVKKLEIEITDLPIAEVTAQYMEYLKTMKVLELSVAGEYLVMAATLLSIKSALLLPKRISDSQDHEEMEDPRKELADMLLEYQVFKEASQSLGEKEFERAKYLSKEPSDISDFYQTIPLRPGQVDLFDLLSAFQRLDKNFDTASSNEHFVMKEEVTIEDKIIWIRQRMTKEKRTFLFSELVTGESKEELITAFLALLELIKEQELAVDQVRLGSELQIYSTLSDRSLKDES